MALTAAAFAEPTAKADNQITIDKNFITNLPYYHLSIIPPEVLILLLSALSGSLKTE